jgi:hypothetical protein
MSRAAITAMLVFISCGTSSVVHDEVMRVTICELTANPKRFDGAYITVLALVESDGLEHTTLIDESCPEKGVAPYVAEAVRESEDMKALQAAMFRGRSGTIDKRISASFKGVFHWYPRRIPSRVMSLESVTDLHVEPRN